MIHGHVKVAPDGTVYVPNAQCGGGEGGGGSTRGGSSPDRQTHSGRLRWRLRMDQCSVTPAFGLAAATSRVATCSTLTMSRWTSRDTFCFVSPMVASTDAKPEEQTPTAPRRQSRSSRVARASSVNSIQPSRKRHNVRF